MRKLKSDEIDTLEDALVCLGDIHRVIDKVSFDCNQRDFEAMLNLCANTLDYVIDDLDTIVCDHLKNVSKLTKAREAAGLSEDQLAEKCMVSTQAIQAYECGERVPRDEIKRLIAIAVNTPVQDLFF